MNVKSTPVIVLAAGGSTRMGTPKQLLNFRGKPMLRHSVEIALAAACGRVIVVLGAEAEKLMSVVSDLDIDVVVNERWREGIGTSIQAGLKAVFDRSVMGAILALGDQPFVMPESLRRLVSVHETTGKTIVASRYAGTVGVPAFFAPDAFARLLALKPDEGCKNVILGARQESACVDCPEAASDVDTPEDYFRAMSI